MIEDGIISKCTVAYKIKVYNDYLGKDTYPVTGTSIRDSSPDELWDYLTKPVDMCRYCGKYKYVKWRQYRGRECDDDWNCRD